MRKTLLALFQNRLTRKADLFEGDYVSTTPGIVIGGCGRSGTTLLRVMVDSHRRICCGPESALFYRLAIDPVKLSHGFDLPAAQLTELMRRSRSRAQFIDLFFQAYSAAVGKPRWADKTPRNIEALDFIFKSFPQARFIHVIRDGRDVACSLRTHPRYKKSKDGQIIPLNTWKPIAQGIERWRMAIRAGQPYRKDPRYMEVRYEELVLNPRPVLEKVLAFVEEPWDENMLAYHEQHTPAREIAKFPQNPEAVEPIKTDAIGRWQRDLTSEDKEIFKHVAGEVLMELEYVADNNW
jgi:protein-tyrosine sulfotransferase